MPRSSPTVRRRLFILVVAVALPLLALVVSAIWFIYDGQRGRAEELLQTRAQSFAWSVQEQVARRQALARTLVSSPALASGDLAAFRLQMDAASAAVNQSAVSLLRPDGSLIETTLVPHGAPLAATRSALDVGRDVQGDSLFVTGVYTSPFTGKVQVAVVATVRQGASVLTPLADGGMVIIAMPSDEVRLMLQRQGLPAGWLASVVDGEGHVIARSDDDTAAGAAPMTPPARSDGTARILRHGEVGGVDSVVAWAGAPGSALSVAVAVPAALFTDPLQRAMLRALILGTALTCLSLLLALSTVRSIAAAIRRVPLAAAIGAPNGATGLLETDALARALTEARTGREAADERAATLAALAAQSSDLIALVTPGDEITYLNDAGLRMVGLTRHDGLRLQDFLSADDRVFFDQVITPARLRDGAWRGTFSLRHFETGAAITVDCNIFALRHPEGEVTAYATVTRDISAQTQAEAELREREAELARVQRIGSVGGFEIDLRGGAFRNRRSPEYLRLHGLSDDAVTEAHDAWVRRLHPEDRGRAEQYFKVQVAGSANDYAAEYRIVTPAGQIRWISAVAEIERDVNGHALRMVGAHIDITAVKAAEAALRESEARFRAALSAVGGTVWTNDRNGGMTGPQPGWAALTGQTQAEYEGHGWTSVVHPDDKQLTLNAWHEAVAHPGLVLFEHRLRVADGQWRLFSVQAVPLVTSDGEVREWVGVHTDITAERDARDQLRQLNEDLEARVRAEVRAREATQARLAQAQRLEALGQLAGGIAHDFNNVLQAVQGGGTLILRRAEDTEAVRRLTRMLLDAAARGASITRRLLAFSRRGELRAETVDAVALLSDMREILAHTLGSGIAVHLDVSPDTPKLLVDKGQLETVLVNLATNARDAMTEGGELTISAAVEMVPDTADEARQNELSVGSYVRIVVSDTGSGMDPATLARASEPFFTTKPPGIGTGLGLAMARGFAAQSGGALGIESTLGAGTRITLWLPISERPPQLAFGPTVSDQPEHGSLRARILLTDDDPLVRATLAEQLTNAGYTVFTAADGIQALAALESGEIDLLVSDLSMRGMNGITLIQQAQSRLPDLPAILLTGFATEAAASAMSGAVRGAVSLLRKPVAATELVERIAIMLEVAASNRAPQLH